MSQCAIWGKSIFPAKLRDYQSEIVLDGAGCSINPIVSGYIGPKVGFYTAKSWVISSHAPISWVMKEIIAVTC